MKKSRILFVILLSINTVLLISLMYFSYFEYNQSALNYIILVIGGVSWMMLEVYEKIQNNKRIIKIKGSQIINYYPKLNGR